MPTEEEAKEYYEKPVLIFLKVKKWFLSCFKKASTEEEFQSAEKDITEIRERLLGGEDFCEVRSK